MKRKPSQVTAPAVSSSGSSSGTESFGRLYKRNGKIYSVYTLKSDKASGHLCEWQTRIVKRRITGEEGMPQWRNLQTDEEPRRLDVVPPTPAAATSGLVQRPVGTDSAEEKAKERELSPSRKRKHEEAKRNRDRRRQKTRVNIGVAFPKWKSLMREKCFQSDADVACFLLESFGRLYKRNGKIYSVLALKSDKAIGYLSDWKTRIVRRRITGEEGMPQWRNLQTDEEPRRLDVVPPTPAAATSGLVQRPVRTDSDDMLYHDVFPRFLTTYYTMTLFMILDDILYCDAFS
ncbi:hypothetical protein ABVT39_012566 [Epinephelus coioides]